MIRQGVYSIENSVQRTVQILHMLLCYIYLMLSEVTVYGVQYGKMSNSFREPHSQPQHRRRDVEQYIKYDSPFKTA